MQWKQQHQQKGREAPFVTRQLRKNNKTADGSGWGTGGGSVGTRHFSGYQPRQFLVFLLCILNKWGQS